MRKLMVGMEDAMTKSASPDLAQMTKMQTRNLGPAAPGISTCDGWSLARGDFGTLPASLRMCARRSLLCFDPSPRHITQLSRAQTRRDGAVLRKIHICLDTGRGQQSNQHLAQETVRVYVGTETVRGLFAVRAKKNATPI